MLPGPERRIGERWNGMGLDEQDRKDKKGKRELGRRWEGKERIGKRWGMYELNAWKLTPALSISLNERRWDGRRDELG